MGHLSSLRRLSKPAREQLSFFGALQQKEHSHVHSPGDSVLDHCAKNSLVPATSIDCSQVRYSHREHLSSVTRKLHANQESWPLVCVCVFCVVALEFSAG